MWLQLTKTETDTAVDVVVVVIIGSFTSPNVTSFMAERSRPSSVTRLGDFSKFLVTNILTNVGQTYIDFFDYFGNLTFQIKTVVATLWVTFGKNALHLFSESGHTATQAKHCLIILFFSVRSLSSAFYFVMSRWAGNWV